MAPRTRICVDDTSQGLLPISVRRALQAVATIVARRGSRQTGREMAQRHSVDDYLETIWFLAFPIGEYRPQTSGTPTLASRVAEMPGVSRASARRMPQRLESAGPRE